MRKGVVWIVAGTALLAGSAVASPLAAQCMGCVSSSACGTSATRGNCKAECFGTACSCSDSLCKAGITVAPVDAEHGALFAAHDGLDQTRSGTVALLVRDCDGSAEFLVFSADGPSSSSRLLQRRTRQLCPVSPWASPIS